MTDILSELIPVQVPDTLYHYTSQAGLLGIIQDHEIWATHTQYLNDSREYIHALELVREELSIRRAGAANAEEITALNEMLTALLGGVQSINVCVSSFSEDGDSLSQWRAYGGTGSGFAIGFLGEFLAAMASKENAFLVRCVYELDKQQAIVHQFIDIVFEEVMAHRSLKETDEEFFFWHHGGNLLPYLHRLAPAMKNLSFKDEREWRIISRPLMSTSERFSYRQGKSTIVPYYRFPLTRTADQVGQGSLREIIVGPTPDHNQSEMAVRSLLSSQRLTSNFTPGGPVPIRKSAIPYRTW